MNSLEMLNGEYILAEVCKQDCFYVAEIRHVVRNEDGGQIQTPIGELYAYLKSADIELYVTHWTANLYFRTDIRYLEKEKITIVETESSQHSLIGKGLKSIGLQVIRPNALYPAKLLEEIGRVLRESNICSEPMSIEIYHRSNGEVMFYGNIFQDEDVGD